MSLHPLASRQHAFRRTLTGLPARRRAVAVIATIGLASGIALLGQGPAAAAGPVSQSQGTFLDGSVLGSPLSDVVSVEPASASNSGGPQDLDVNPLTVSALNAVTVPLGNGINLLGPNGILALGAVNQYAEANPDGSSRAASGAVTDSGAVAVGGTSAFPANATVSLEGLIGPALASALADVDVTVGALSATAAQTAGGTQTGDYQIANLSLSLNSPLVAGIVDDLGDALTALQPVVDGLPGLIANIPGIGLAVQIGAVPNLTDVLNTLTTVTTADGSITANLQTGAVSIDVAKVLTSAGLDLNNLPDGLANGTQLLPYIAAALTNDLLPAISDVLSGLTQQLTDAINDISVTVLGVPVDLSVLAPVLNPVIAQVIAPVDDAVSGLGDTVIGPLADALTTLIGLSAHAQIASNGSFTERTLQLSILPQAGPPVAVVNLAAATVGPNAGPTAPVVPTATGLDPDHGPAAGGQTVTVTGTGFVPGSTSVTIGGTTVPADEVTVTSPTTLTFTTPAHAAGPVDVTVTTPGGTSTPALDYTYDPAGTPVVPTATSLDPDHGPAAGGQTVTVTGTGFVPGSTTVTIGGTTVPADEVTVTSPTTLTFTTPAHAAGPVDVTVTTPGGTSTPALDYTYDPAATTKPEPPVITDPTDGSTTTDPTPVISGTGTSGSTVTVTEGGVTLCTAKVAANGHWSCVPTSPLSSGSHTIVAVQRTKSGAVSGPSDPVTFTVNDVQAQPSGGGSTNLASTGLELTSLIAVALVLAAAGAMLIGAGRRRRTES